MSGQAANTETPTPSPAPAPAPASAPTPSATGVPAAPAWYPGATPEDIAYISSKGWDKSERPAEMILGSYRHLEKLFGADKAGNTVMLPGQNADEKTLNEFYTRLGRPAAADKYTAMPKDFQGMSEEMATGLRDVAFKHGLTDKQVAAIKEWNNTEGAKLKTTLEAQAVTQTGIQTQKLKSEWGAAEPQNTQVAKEAVAKLGWTREQIDAMQIGIGYDGVMKLAFQIGSSIGEGKFVTGEGGREVNQNQAMTPDQAKAALKNLEKDTAWMKKWTSKNKVERDEAVAHKAQLSAWANPSK